MKVLAAFNNFKNSMKATEAVAISRSVLEPKGVDVLEAPITDGGEGFCAILTDTLKGNFELIDVMGPTFKPLQAQLGWVDIESLSDEQRSMLQLDFKTGKLAIIEMAQASGYECLSDDERNAWKTSSFGTGQLIQYATSNGASAILLGIGGSATNDCGIGALEALGVKYYDASLQPVTQVTPEKWKNITTLGGTLHVGNQLPPIRIACDVDNPLLGDQGATAVYGPQKGIKPNDISKMDRWMWKMANRILGLFGKDPETWSHWHSIPGTGAAGGIGFALLAAGKDTKFIKGFPLTKALINLDQKLRNANYILTGEGRLDASSLSGKGALALLSNLQKHQKALYFYGSVDESLLAQLKSDYPQVTWVQLSPSDWDLATALARSKDQLKNHLEEQFA